MDLFDHALRERMKSEAPLAARMRPHTLEEFVGPGKLLQRVIQTNRLFSITILWKPPGSSKYHSGEMGYNFSLHLYTWQE